MQHPGVFGALPADQHQQAAIVACLACESAAAGVGKADILSCKHIVYTATALCLTERGVQSSGTHSLFKLHCWHA
jgi:hypothetical protein